jgi:hypothetical protein
MYYLIVINFKLCLLGSVIGVIFLLGDVVKNYPESVEFLGSSEIKTIVAPLIYIVLTILFWFYGYKRNEGHGAALLMGWFIIVAAFGMSISETVHGQFYNDTDQVILWYIGVSHVLYGVLNLKRII